MRRLLMVTCGAAALLLGPPASAGADGFHLELGTMTGLRVSDFQDCPGSYCAESPVELRLERAGTIVAGAGPELSPQVFVGMRYGDIVRIFSNGVERATIPFTPEPGFDDVTCAMVGRTTLTGRFQRGIPDPQRHFASPGYGLLLDDNTYLRLAVNVYSPPGIGEAAITTDGNRWTATFPRALRPDDAVLTTSAYTVATPVGTAAIANSSSQRICESTLVVPPPDAPTPQPPVQPPPPVNAPCTAAALRADPAFSAAARRAVARLRLKRVRRGRAALAGIMVCPDGAVSASIIRRGAVIARGTTTGATLRLERTARAARLAGRRRAAVKVVLRIRDAAGAEVSWSRRVTLR